MPVAASAGQDRSGSGHPLLHRGRRGCQSSCGSPPRRLLHHHQRPVFCVSVLQVGVDSVGVGGGGAGPGPLYLVGGDLSFDGSGLGLALGWWQSFVLVAFSGSFVHGCRRSPAFASSGHRLIERGRSRGSSVILSAAGSSQSRYVGGGGTSHEVGER